MISIKLSTALFLLMVFTGYFTGTSLDMSMIFVMGIAGVAHVKNSSDI